MQLGGGGAGFVSGDPQPVRAKAGRKFVMPVAARGRRARLIFPPRAVAAEIHFNGELDRLFGVVREMETFLVEAGPQVRIARHAGSDFVFPPRAAPTFRFAEFPEIVSPAEPERRLRLGAENIAIELVAGVVRPP